RGARFIGAATQDLGAGGGYRFGRLHDLALGFYRTRACHHDELVAADFEAVDAHLGVLLFEFLADELVWRGEADGALDSGRGFEGFQTGGHIADAHHADDHPLLAFNGVDLVTKFANPLADIVDFRLRGVGPH